MQKRAVMIIIVILALAGLNLVYAKEIDFSYPKVINSDEELSVNVGLKDFSTDIYDVKIDVIGEKSLNSRIWNGNSWQSTYNYVNDAINSNLSNSSYFKIRLSGESQRAQFLVRIRNSKQTITSFTGYYFNLSRTESSDENNNSNDDNNNEDEENKTSNVELELNWNDEDIINGKEFEIEVNALNLLNKDYDLKIWIYDDDKNRPISQTYDGGKWISSNNYLNKIFSQNNDNEKIKLRIKNDNRDFSGDAIIAVRIRESGSSSYKQEAESDIEIKEAEEDTQEQVQEQTNSETTSADSSDKIQENIEPIEYPVTGESIRISSESIKSMKNPLYKSKNEQIKEYSLIGFCILAAVLLISLILIIKFKKIGNDREENTSIDYF